jgi:hypothetical protein
LSVTDIEAGQIDAIDTRVELCGIAYCKIEPERHGTEERADLLRVAAIKDSAEVHCGPTAATSIGSPLWSLPMIRNSPNARAVSLPKGQA